MTMFICAAGHDERRRWGRISPPIYTLPLIIYADDDLPVGAHMPRRLSVAGEVDEVPLTSFSHKRGHFANASISRRICRLR